VLVLLGFGSGLPLALIEDNLQAWLRRLDFDLLTVGFITVVGLPAALQAFWAPLVDRFAPRWRPLARLGRRRAWLALTQVLLIGGIAAMGALGPRDNSSPLLAFALVALAVAFVSATQDIALNAYRADVLPDRLRGSGAATYISGYRLAMIATGAGVLALAEHVPWNLAYIAGSAVMLVALLGTWLAPEPPDANAAPSSLREAIVEPLRSFFGAPGGLLLLVFVLIFKLPDYLAARMTTPLLLDLGLSNTELAGIRNAFGLAMTIVGALLGGGLVARLGLLRALLLFGVLQALSNAGFLWLASSPAPARSAVAIVVAVESLCTGLVAAGFVAFLMACCERRYSAFQYALLTSVMLAGSKLAGPLSGVLVIQFGYARFFALTILAGLPGLLLLWLLARRAQRGWSSRVALKADEDGLSAPQSSSAGEAREERRVTIASWPACPACPTPVPTPAPTK
jgi:PAT family beta-lactamase induction signal transducer AmpG